MGKIVLSIYVSLDGYVSGPKGELDFLPETPDTSRYGVDLLTAADAILLGGRTYALFESFWPTAATNPSTYANDLPLAERINALPKFVFSRTLKKADWNATIIREDVPAGAAKLKQRYEGALVLFGSAMTAQTLLRHGMIDELQLLVCPVLLGGGLPLFERSGARAGLKLARAETLRPSDIVALYYHPAGR
jgi:dihydrofolate reductase